MIPPPFFIKEASLAHLTTFGIGGPARWLAPVHDLDQLRQSLVFIQAEKIPYIVLGKGSNCLFDDQGFDGVVIHNKWSALENKHNGLFLATGGYSFARLGAVTARSGWSGLEFAAGIPGSVGGAIYMNAGASRQETASSLKEVSFLHLDGTLETFSREKMTFAYRSSPFQTMKGVILQGTFQLTSHTQAKADQKQLLAYRTETQPYASKSAGCIFRNPSSCSAGALIEQCGLKNYQIGGARVSPQHANFIVNSDNASASDVLLLMKHIKNAVKEKASIELTSEICYIPFCSKFE